MEETPGKAGFFMHLVAMLLEAAVLASSLSLDAFIASFAYGSNKIKIPFSSVMVIDLVCGGILGASLFLGALLRPYLSPGVSNMICFLILFVIGLVKLLDNLTKALIRKHGGLSRDIQFSLCNLRFVLNVYADPEKADVDCSKSISFAEAFSLSIALSLDGMAVGFGAALGDVNSLAVFLASLLTNAGAVLLGAHIGNRIAASLRFNVAWLSGAILIVMAVLKIV